MAKCNECVSGPDYTDSKEAKDNINNYYGTLTNWCKEETKTPGTVAPPKPPTTPFVPVPGGGGGTAPNTGGTGTRPGGVSIGGAPSTSATGGVNSTASARPSSVSKPI